MEGTARFFRHALFSYKGLFGWLDPKVYFLVMVLGPLSQLMFFSCVVKYANPGQDISGYVASNALLLCVLNSIFGILTVVRSDRSMGTLQLVIASPANKFTTFLARSFFHVLNGIITAFLGLLFGLLAFHIHLPIEIILPMVMIWLVSIFAASGLGLLLGSCSLWSPSIHMWSNLVADALLLFSGANYSRTVMPDWMFQVSNYLPLTRGVELTKEIMKTGFHSDMWPVIGQEVLLGSAYFLIGIIFIRYAEYVARRKGTMDLE